MTFLRSAAHTAGFAVLYLLAIYAGRLTIMEGSLSLVWPAAGVLAAWFVIQRRSGWRWLDVLAAGVITMAVDLATGTGVALACVFVAANLAQAFVFVALAGRWLPGVWTPPVAEPLARVSQLWRLIAAAAVGAGCGAAIGPTGQYLLDGGFSSEAAAVWLARNTVGIVLVGVALLEASRRLGASRAGDARPAAEPRRWLPSRPQLFEYVLITVTSGTAYYLTFGVNRNLPIAFALIAMTVWAAFRMPTGLVIGHGVVFGTVAVLFTLHADGPFAHIGAPELRALVTQLFVGTVAVIGLVLALGRDERDALIERLQLSEGAASGQAQMMSTIVESMNEGLAVIDGDGRFLLRNRAATRLLGGVGSLTGRVAPGSDYGLFRPDGTPLPEHELPYRQALAGADVAAVDILVRHAGLPDGRILRFDATTLAQPGGPPHAVVVFHDVTADRRHRDELMSFAGMVAHDLLNPLTTVEGWAEVLEQELAGYALADRVTRIQRATARMRSFLNGLLAYTSARDGRMARATVNLYWLVKDVATSYLEQAVTAGAPPPLIEFGQLSDVDADPVLTRQLLESLVDNALKFAPAGAIPHVVVTSQPYANGMIRVDVTDNGVGIAPGQREAVFATFHRSGDDSRPTGTGLGLAICKRIVERHGGTIVATGNPYGRGTQMSFTLPAARTSFPAAAMGRQPAAGLPA